MPETLSPQRLSKLRRRYTADKIKPSKKAPPHEGIDELIDQSLHLYPGYRGDSTTYRPLLPFPTEEFNKSASKK
jgi:hypothetical protein